MRKLVYYVATSADGFIAGPAGQFDFFSMQGDHIAAQLEELPETMPAHVRAAIGLPFRVRRFDTVLMGRKTFELARAAGIVEPYAPLETIVFSRSEPATQHGTLRVTSEEPLPVVRELKGRPGQDIWLCGGAQLAGALLPEIDELVLKINPVLAGDGIRLFDSSFAPQQLALQGQRTFESGVTWLTFRMKGADSAPAVAFRAAP